MSIGSDAEQPVKIAYARAATKADLNMLKQLDSHLATWRRQGKISWYDEWDWDGQFLEQEDPFDLEAPRIIILPISPQYFQSDRCYIQMERALELAISNVAQVIPILLRETPGLSDTLVGQLRALPEGERPIASWPHRENAYAQVATAISRVVESYRERQTFRTVSSGVMRAELPPHRHHSILPREALVRTLYATLMHPETSALALTGLKGVGKSTLATQVYSYAEERRLAGEGPFAGEALWLRIEATSTMSDLIRALTFAGKPSSRNIDPPSPRSQTSSPYAHVALKLFESLKNVDPPRLIVLDQCEEWLSITAQERRTEVAEWLDLLNGHPCASRILLTAQTAPQGTGRYRPMYLQEFRVDGFQGEEGAALLRRWGVQAPEHVLRQAVENCGGNAFALVLLDKLRLQRRVSLATLLDDPLYRHLWTKNVKEQLLDDLFAHQFQGEVERTVLAALSLYREAVPVRAVHALLTEQKHITEEQTLMVLEYAQEWQLLRMYQGSEERYAFYPVVADFIREHLPIGDLLDVRKAHLAAVRYYLRQHTQSQERRQRLEDLHALVEIIWHLCRAEQWQEALTVMTQEDLFTDLHRRGENALLLELYKQLLSAPHWQPETQQAARLSNELGEVSYELGRRAEAKDAFARALHLYQATETLEGQVKALNHLGALARSEGSIEQALLYYQEALRLGEQIPQHLEHGVTLNNLGRTVQSQGQSVSSAHASARYYREALGYYQQALSIYTAVGDVAEKAKTLNNIGEVYDQQYQSQKASKHFRQALDHFREIGEKRGEGIVCNNLGLYYKRRWQKQESIDYYVQALRIFQAIGDRWQEGITFRNIGHFYLQLGRREIALACFVLAGDIFETLHASERGAIPSEVQAHLAGEQPFEHLLAEVKPRAEEIVDEVLKRPL